MRVQREFAFRLALGAAMLLAACGASQCLLAGRRASERSTMPRAVASRAPSSSPDSHTGPAVGELGVAIRLVDQLEKAQVAVPSLADRQVRSLLSGHWRRHLAPYTGLGGDLARLVQHVGLSLHPTASTGEESGKKSAFIPSTSANRSSAGTLAGTRASAKGNNRGRAGTLKPPLGDTERRERNVRTFGLGEGSFSQRECIVAPPPGSLRFRLHLPRGAKLRVAPAVLGEGEAAFSVAFRPTIGGERRLLGTQTRRGPSRRFVDWTVDLAAAGLDNVEGELELATATTSREPVVALWASPIILAPEASQLPYNVLFVIVDAMRSDAISASHDPAEDERRRQAKHPPLDAWFNAMPEVAPELDRLAANGAIWKHSWSAAMWTRPSTVSLLTGLRAGHTGLDILALELIGDQRRNFYARRPPLLPLLMRQAGATTTAFVNNMYLSGSVGVGVDFGFESVQDHRLQTQDTRDITNDALKFLEEQGKERFFLLLNYASPHAPYEPGAEDMRAIHAAKGRPADQAVQNYLGEVHKDDAAIGVVLRKLDQLQLRNKTLVIVTADHGETMSAAHDVVAVDVAAGVPSGRFTHLSTMWEEAARVALVLSLPGRIPSGRRLEARAQGFDIMPTVLELEGLPIPAGLDGRSLVPEIDGKPVEDRPVVIEGRGARSIIDGHYHLVVRDPVARRLRYHDEEFERALELFDLDNDPGERKDIAAKHPDLVATLRAKLEQNLAQKSEKAAVAAARQRLHLRFSTAGKIRQLEVVLGIKGDAAKVTPVGIEARAIHVAATEVRIVTPTSADRAVGFDVDLPAPGSSLTWQIKLDGKPWPADHVYAGPLGIALEGLVGGLSGQIDAALLDASALPHVVPNEELGLFVTRDPSGAPAELEASAEAQLEAQQAMQAWGYARKPLTKKTE